ncbi:MAG: DUF2795 domain-containing protein [Rhodospirillales bacterium]|nr:DUF2795 domain-containing protein [Rhodospirillales bacterium]
MALAPHSTKVIAQALSGIEFPAGKSQLVEWARNNGAEKDVVGVLEKMPDEQYTSMADVLKGVGKTD